MTDQTQQAVVDKPDAAASPAAEGTSARTDGDDLDTLLKQFDQSTQRPAAPVSPPAQAAAPTTDMTSLLAEVQAIKAGQTELQNRKFKEDMEVTVKDIRGDLDPDVFDNSLMESWLDREARLDPRLQRAWLQKESDPATFNRVKAELGKRFHKQFSKLVDKQATEDRMAVTQAVRGASTRAPVEQPANYGRKSNAEFRQDVIDKYGFDPGV